MSTGDDDLSSGINARLRPRKSYVSSPHTTKTTRRVDSKASQEKPKRVSGQPKNSHTKSDNLSKKSNFSSVLEFLCPYCDKIFVSKQTVTKHARRIHFLNSKQGDKGVFNCLYCSHSEPEPNDIFKHMIDSHPNQYFACLDCHTRFPSTKELAEHKLNVCERQKLHYKSNLPQKSNRCSKKSHKLDRQVIIREEERHGFNSIVISCELKPTHVTDAADIEDNITTNLILPSINKGNKIIDKNAVILLDDLQWKKRIPQNFSFHNTDTDQILSRLGVVHRSPRTGESTRKDWFKAIDDATQKFERCFDTNFYSKVASNVQENLSKFLDGSFNFNPDPNHTIKTRKAKNSVPINTVEGFPILLSCEQYSRNIFDGYMPRSIAPKHKWKWDNLENDRNSFNPDQIKRDSHVNNCIVTLVSSLDIWTQLCMRHKFEEKFKTIPFERKTEKKKIISNELKEILESRQLPTSTKQCSHSCTALVKAPDNLDFPTSLGLTPTTTEYDIAPAVLSGEWVRPRCYVCCACGAQTRDPRTLSTHILTQHPNAQVEHYEIPGELLVNADILKHLYVPPSPVQNRTRLPRGFRECTKCNKSITIEDLHQHMLDCAGDMPTVRRKCRYRHFGVRKRRPRIQDSRIHKKIRKDIHRQNGRPRPKIRSEVGDAETIRKMLADLPAKRHRVIVSPVGSSLRPKKKMNTQLDQFTFTKRHAEDRKINTDSSSGLVEYVEPNYLNNPLKESKRKNMKKKITRRNTVILNKTLKRSQGKGMNLRPEPNQIGAGNNPLPLSSDSVTSSADSQIQVLSLGNQPNRINVNSELYNTREQANRSNNDRSNNDRSNNDRSNNDRSSNYRSNNDRSNNDRSNNRENQNPDQNDNNGNLRDQDAPIENVPLKHSIARLTADSGTHDKAVQFHHLFLVQQECNNITQNDTSGQPVLFEDKVVPLKFDKPPLDTYNNKNKLNKQRKGLNDCIAMLKNKLVEPNKAPDVSIQCKIDDETDSPKPGLEISSTNSIDVTDQCSDKVTESLITPRLKNDIHTKDKIINLSFQQERGTQVSELVTMPKMSSNIELETKNAQNNTESEFDIQSSSNVNLRKFETPDVGNCERNNHSSVENTSIPSKSGDSQSSDTDQNGPIKIDNYQVGRQSITANCQDIDVIAKTSEPISLLINEESATPVMQDSVSRHEGGNDGYPKFHETNKKNIYRPEIIPPAHSIVDVQSIPTAPLDLSGKLYVNEVIAHCSKQEIPYNSSAHVYETLDLSNKNISRALQKKCTDGLPINEVVVDLRVKHVIPTTSTNASNDCEDINDEIMATDLSLRHTEFMPTDLSVKRQTKTGFYNERTLKDYSIMGTRPTSNVTCTRSDIIGLNLSADEFPTDLSRKCLRQDANNKMSSLIMNDIVNSSDITTQQNINKHIVNSGKHIISQQTPLEFNTNVTSYKIKTRQITTLSEVQPEEFNQSRNVQYKSDRTEVNKSGSSIDEVPVNTFNPTKEVVNAETLHKALHKDPQSHGSKTLETLNMSLELINTSNFEMRIPQTSVSIAPNSTTTERQESITQISNEKSKALHLPFQLSKPQEPQCNKEKKNYEQEVRNVGEGHDQDLETAKKIASLPKELVEILGNMPIDHRNQLLSILPQYVSVSTAGTTPQKHDSFHDSKITSYRHSQSSNESENTEISKYSFSGVSKNHAQVVDRYQTNTYYQSQEQTKKSNSECVQFSADLEETNVKDNIRRSIELNGIIDLTDENNDNSSTSVFPEKENKTESPALRSFGFKTNNEKTASLRAVRIKAPSERAKSILSDMQLKKTTQESNYINKQSTDINPVLQKFETSSYEETKTRCVNLPVSINTNSSDGLKEAVKENTMLSSTVCDANNVLSRSILEDTKQKVATLNSKSLGEEKVKISETEAKFENATLEYQLSSPKIENIQRLFDEDDSEDDVSLAVIVKQKKLLLNKDIVDPVSVDDIPNLNVNNTKEITHNYYKTTKEHSDIVLLTPDLDPVGSKQEIDNVSFENDSKTVPASSMRSETSSEMPSILVEYKTEKNTQDSNEEYCQVVRTSSTDQDSSLTSNNNTIVSKVEVQTKKTSQADTFDSEKIKEENSYINTYSANLRCGKLTENNTSVTPPRRSKRGKSLFIDNSDDSCHFQSHSDAGEQRGPLTKKQLIFSKLLQDEEITAAKIPFSKDEDNHDENDASSDIDFSFIGELANNIPEKGHKRKTSRHKRKKQNKLKALVVNPVALSKKTTHGIDKDDTCKMMYDGTKLEGDKGELQLRIVKDPLPSAKNAKITGKRKSCSSGNEQVLPAKEKKLITIIDDDKIEDKCDKTNTIERTKTNGNTINVAEPIRPTKSVFPKSKSEICDSFDLPHKVPDADAITKKQSEIKSSNELTLKKTFHNDENIVYITSSPESVLDLPHKVSERAAIMKRQSEIRSSNNLPLNKTFDNDETIEYITSSPESVLDSLEGNSHQEQNANVMNNKSITTVSILDAKDDKECDMNSDCVEVAHHRMYPVKEPDRVIEKSANIAGKRKSMSTIKNQCSSPAKAKKIKSTTSNENINSDYCERKIDYTSYKSFSDSDTFDYDMIHELAQTFRTKSKEERTYNHSYVTNGGETVQTPELMSSPLQSFSVTSIEDIARRISETKMFLSDSDESSKSDEPLTKYIQEKDKNKLQIKRSEKTQQEPREILPKTDQKSMCLEKHDTKTPEDYTEKQNKEIHETSSTSSTLEFDFLFLFDNLNTPQKKDKQNKSKPLPDDQTYASVSHTKEINRVENTANIEDQFFSDTEADILPEETPAGQLNALIECESESESESEVGKKIDKFNTMYTKLAELRRCCSKSVLAESGEHDPYDIRLLHISDEELTKSKPKGKHILSIADGCKEETLRTIRELSRSVDTIVNVPMEKVTIRTEKPISNSLNSSNGTSSSEVTPMEKVSLIPENAISNSINNIDVSPSSEEKLNITCQKFYDINSDDIVKPSKSNKYSSTAVSLKERKQQLKFRPSPEKYDPYDINFLDTVTEAEPFTKRVSLINPSTQSKTNKSFTERDALVETVEQHSVSSDISNQLTENNDTNKQDCKEHRFDSDESSKSDEPLTKYIEEKGKKKPENHEEYQKTLRKRKKKSLSVTSEKSNPDSGNEDNEETIRSEQFMESFGFFSKRKPRKSNLLATKKISETYNLINSFCESEENSHKKNVHFENRKTGDDEDVTRTVSQQQLAHRGLSRDEALFLDCCELLNGSHNNDGSGRAKESSDCKINCYKCVQTSVQCLNLLEKHINDTLEGKCDDGDVDSITAQDILESEEVRNLENDLITGLKEAAACASSFKAKPITSYSPAMGVDSKPDIDIISHPSDVTKTKKAYEVKEKMYPDIIEDIDMFEDKFDKIKRKCRSQAAKQTQYVETSTSSKSRKKSEKKKRKKSPKKNSSQGSVPTKGALKGFEGVKVSISTSEINMASILSSSTPSKKKKKSYTKRKRDRKHSEIRKSDSDHKSKDTQKKVDVYEFMDSEEFESRPSTLMERFKSINNKDIPSTSKSKPTDEITTESMSDGDDFVYMSDDYICSDAETENSLSCEIGNTKTSSEVKKSLSTQKRKDTTEKNAVMGKIFKHNAVRAEKKISRTKEHTKQKANLDQLFDSLLEEPNSPMRSKTLSPPKKDGSEESSLSQGSDITKRVSKLVKNARVNRDDLDIAQSRKIERCPEQKSYTNNIVPNKGKLGRCDSQEPYTSLISQNYRRGSPNSPLKAKELSFDKEDKYPVCDSSTASMEDENESTFKRTNVTLSRKIERCPSGDTYTSLNSPLKARELSLDKGEEYPVRYSPTTSKEDEINHSFKHADGAPSKEIEGCSPRELYTSRLFQYKRRGSQISPIRGKELTIDKEDEYPVRCYPSTSKEDKNNHSFKHADGAPTKEIEGCPSRELYTSRLFQYKRRGSQISPIRGKELTIDKEDEYAVRYCPSTSKDDENKHSFKHTSRKKKEQSYENYDENDTKRRTMISPHYDEHSLSRVDDRKSKEFKVKPTGIEKNKSNSYDYTDESISTLDDTGVARRQRARRKCTVGKQNVLAETWSSESEPDGIPPRPNSAESVVAGGSRKKKNKKKDSHVPGSRKSGNRQVSAKREPETSARSNRNSCESISRVVPTTRPSAVCSSSSKARARPSTYYWSEEGEPEHVQQHGWIVGDSHKKLVTMLAHAKGKRNNDDKRNLVE